MNRLLTIILSAVMLTTATCGMAFAKDVYVTKKGKKYHVQECRWIKNRETIKHDDKEAAKKGYTPCRCIEKEEKKQ